MNYISITGELNERPPNDPSWIIDLGTGNMALTFIILRDMKARDFIDILRYSERSKNRQTDGDISLGNVRSLTRRLQQHS
ncbi:hypothetical protein J6590_013654 [Homalodisca vitripennis]|nr:hypothetical protein J6590_013654 [Homalodisca vitripennis]